MKRIKSLGINFSDAQQLTRQQMKKVMGGIVPTTGNTCNAYCTNNASICTGRCSYCVDGWNAGGKLCATNPD